jgi:hypothetical protein
MARMSRVVPIVLVALTLAAGCRSRTAPSDEIAGDWRGTIVDSVSGSGTIGMTLKRQGPALSGTWSATFGVSGETRSGVVSGTLVGASVTLVFVYDPPMTCAGGQTIESTMAFNGTLAAAGWAGSYVTLACSGARTGTIDVARP